MLWSQAWWHKLVMLTVWRLKQRSLSFRMVGYIDRLCVALGGGVQLH